MLLIIPMIFLIGSLSLTTWVYQRALDPLYGGVPTHLYLNPVIWAGSILGGLGPAPPGWSTLLFVGSWVVLLPNTAYWAAVYTSRLDDATIGPIATHVLVLFPTIYFGVSLMKRMVLSFVGGAAIATWAVSVPLRSPSNTAESDSRIRFSWRLLVPAIVISVLPTVLPALAPPLLPHPLLAPYTRPNFPLRILSSTQSVTGIVVVGESLLPEDWQPGTPEPHPLYIRYLRASHSLLGGVWYGRKAVTKSKGPPSLDSTGTPIGDSIYSVFVLQEAIRLVDTTDRAIKNGEENALIIGLGAGIAATALNKHGIHPTIVEIDPAVYNASRQYFGLPEPGPGKLFLEDARKTVRLKRRAVDEEPSKGERYDYVIHDCFSGGGVPAHLFSVEFWDDLKAIMNVDGVVAVAYYLNSNPAKAILSTLKYSFGRCRVFHDAPDVREDPHGFINMVFFCSPAAKPLTFRSAQSPDFLDSHQREQVLSNFAQREIHPSLIHGETDERNVEKWILRDGSNKLNEWQQSGALEHWKIMRKVLPAPFWETY
ncbi:S-adenosyl-L-methionine-dependent methyltransferase [Amylostereum chailletii]|nr:S-adenosyl-L-methionine-dependent methyltransferase [Amylostereum chailletii]